MTGWDDLPDEMRGERIDAGTMERLLRGRMTPDDAPPGYADVASILLAAASPPQTGELAMEVTHVAAARSILTERAAGHRSTRRLVAGLIVAGALMAVPGLAAANALPDPAQHAVSSVLEKVGLSVPANTVHPTPAPTTVHPARTGSEISTIATTTDATGVAKGAEISTIASGGKSQAGQHGQASEQHGGGSDASGDTQGADAAASHAHTGGPSANAGVTPGSAASHP